MVSHDYLVGIVEKMSNMMGEFEDKALNSDQLSDLTVRQIYYLDTIYKLGEPTFSQLAEELDVTKPTVTVAVNTLIKNGYLTKVQSSQDRRVFHLLMSEKGKKAVRIHDRAHRDFASEITECLNQTELEQLVSIFKKVIDCNQID